MASGTNPIDYAYSSQSASQAVGYSSALQLPPLLRGLSAEALSEIRRHLRDERLDQGAVLWRVGDRTAQVIFPMSGTISIRVPTKDGHGIEVASVGPEGAVGLHDDSGLYPEVSEAVVHIPGRFMSIPAPVFASAASQSAELKRLAVICNGWLLMQSQQIAACNAIHSADARFCRWLMRASEAVNLHIVPVTHETIAHALGIRRTTATLIAQQLQARRIISYRRGKIDIRDRAALRAAACECCDALGQRHWPSELLRTYSASGSVSAAASADPVRSS
jgi:CRP-like cAMP-binding protein